MRVFLEEEPVNCMLVKFKYKTSPGWDALKNGGGGWRTWDQTLWEGEGRLAEKCVALMLKGPRGDKVK